MRGILARVLMGAFIAGLLLNACAAEVQEVPVSSPLVVKVTLPPAWTQTAESTRTPTPTLAPSLEPAVDTETPASVSPSPLPTETLPSTPVHISCGKLSLDINPALAIDFQCLTIEESSDPEVQPYTISPAYTQIILLGYPALEDTQRLAEISVFPVQRFRELLSVLVNPRVSTLQALIGGRAPDAGELPFLPVISAYQIFHARYSIIPFQKGSGIRYLAMYSQNNVPVNNEDIFITYQGLTSNGKYWISMTLPISHPSLPRYGDEPPGGDWDAFDKDAAAYYAKAAADLKAQPAESFVPSILQVDALINSMIVTP
jgi:hypothetical protein